MIDMTLPVFCNAPQRAAVDLGAVTRKRQAPPRIPEATRQRWFKDIALVKGLPVPEVPVVSGRYGWSTTTWNRDYLDGERAPDTGETRRVVDLANGDVYNDDPKFLLRGKFLAIAVVFNPLWTPVNAAITVGYNVGATIGALARCDFPGAKRAASQAATAPLSFFGILAGALVGLVLPYLGRKIVAVSSRHLLLWSFPCMRPLFNLRYVDDAIACRAGARPPGPQDANVYFRKLLDLLNTVEDMRAGAIKDRAASSL